MATLGKSYRFGFDRYFETTIHSFEDKIEDILDYWEDSLTNKLSDEMPLYMKNKLRYPREREFPYMNTGQLVDSVSTSVDTHTSISGKSAVIEAKATIGSNHGLRGRYDAGWLGWREDVFSNPNSEGRGGVPSLRRIFDRANRERRRARNES